MSQHIKNANIRSRLDEFQLKSVTQANRQALIAELESLDGLMHHAMKTDISKGTNAVRTWWSPDLRNSKLSVVY